MRPAAVALKKLLEKPGLLGKPGLLVMPGCGDGMGARLIGEAGFASGFVSGSSISALRLARPDMDLLDFHEMKDAVECCVAAAPGVLWLADGDTGYGNAIAVQRCVQAYAQAGAACVLIEDKAWPRTLGNQGAKLVIDRAPARLRIRAAVEAARDAGILLLARTDSRTSRGFAEAQARIEDFVAEGADILFLDSPQSEAEMRAGVAACAGRPSISVTAPGARHFMPDDAGLEAAGIRIAVYPQHLLAATVQATRAVLAGLKGAPMPPIASPSELQEAVRMADYLASDARLAYP